MNRLADLILSHKRLVIAFWAVVTIAAFAAVGPAGDSLSQQFNIPGREGYETNKDIAEIYGSGGDVAPLVPVVTLPKGTTVDSPGVTAELASALARVKQAMPDVRIASYASTHDRTSSRRTDAPRSHSSTTPPSAASILDRQRLGRPRPHSPASPWPDRPSR